MRLNKKPFNQNLKFLFKISLLLCFIFNESFIFSQLRKNKYDNPNINSMYSSHPDRPFKYGYTYNLQEIQDEFLEHFNAYGINNGDIVAEIGAASGWMEGVFSVLCDSVTFYVQDIDTVYSNKEQLDAVVKHFSKQRLTPQTNSFHFVLGDITQTNLPNNTFDIIILNNTFHELSDVTPMLKDIKSKLKPDGRLVIHEVFANDYRKVKHGGCKIPALTVDEVIELVAPSGLYLTDMRQPPYSIQNYLSFSVNQEKSLHLSDELKKIESYFSPLYSLNNKKISKNEKKVNEIKNVITNKILTNKNLFNDFQLYLYSLTDELYEQKEYISALNIGKLLIELYPNKIANHQLLVNILMEKKRNQEALEQLKKAKKTDQSNMPIRAAIIELSSRIYDFNTGLREYKSALKIDSTHAPLYASIGNLISTKELFEDYPNYSKAIEAYQKAIQLDSLSPYYFEILADLQFRMNKMDSALSSINQAIYLNPFEKEYFKLRAKIYKEMEDYDKLEKDKERIKLLKKSSKK